MGEGIGRNGITLSESKVIEILDKYGEITYEVDGTTPKGVNPKKYPEEEILLSDIWNGQTIADTSETILKLVKDGTIKIGDYVAYKPNTGNTYTIDYAESNYYGTQTINQDSSLRWRVFGIENEKVILISNSVAFQGHGVQGIELNGSNGYNNSVRILNDLCETLYSKTGVGSARSINIEDIEKNMDLSKWDYHNYININVDTGLYGGKKVLTGGSYYNPKIFNEEINGKVNGISGTKYGLSTKQTEYVYGEDSNNVLAMTQTYWIKSLIEENFKEDIYYDLLINNGQYNSYYLASRCTDVIPEDARFLVRAIHGSNVGEAFTFDATGNSSSASLQVRPIIMLESKMKIDRKDENGVWILK